MKPIGYLIREHRLIKRMVGLMTEELRKVSGKNEVNPGFIDVAVDFLRVYADRTHHGKEEDILFETLARKQLSSEHKKVMDELMAEHVLARKTVGNLVEAKASYVSGNVAAVKDIAACLRALVTLYPAHIEKEDKHFFSPCLDYFSQKEQDGMLQEFWEFDRKMIHEKYQKVVEGFEEKPPAVEQ